jgi:3-phosphoshikimate 1-carboxyvinyltransferase
MSDVKLKPSRLCGSVTAPPSKSAAHRAILCAALAKGISVIHNIALSDDMRATIGAIQAMGATVQYENQTLQIDTTGSWAKSAQIDCGESGSTLRFFIPVAAALGMYAEFIGHGRLPQRPIGVYLDCLPAHGVACQTEGGLPFQINGQLTPGRFVLPGNISSQFITGLLLALPLLDGDSELELSSPLESAAYVDMTIAIQREFGVQIEPTGTGWHICGSQSYKPRSYTVEGDWSQAAFFLAAGALGGELSIAGLNRNSTQGDKALNLRRK